MSILKSQSGFIGGAFVATLVASVAMLGTLISLTAGMAQKVGVTQGDLNSKKTADRLVEYILENKVRNIDTDSDIEWLELPGQFHRYDYPVTDSGEPINDGYPTSGDFDQYDRLPGFLERFDPNDEIRQALGKDANGNHFRICSGNLQTNSSTQIGRNNRFEIQVTTVQISNRDYLRIPVLAIIGAGPNGQLDSEDRLCGTIFTSNTVDEDDTLKIIKYGQVLEYANAKRLALLRDGVPECTRTQSLEYVNVTDDDGNPTGAQVWQCRDNYMGFAAQDFSGAGQGSFTQCMDSERLALNSDGTLSCVVVDQLANRVPENVHMGKLAAGICHRGYAIGSLMSVSDNTFSFRCQRLESYGDEAGPEAREVTIPLHTRSCDIDVQPDQFRALYQSRDGTMRCLGMPRNLLSGSDCSGRPYIIFDRGKLYCFAGDLSYVTHQTCLPNQILQFQTITNNVQCLDGTGQDPRNWIVPYGAAHQSCATGDYIVHDGTNYICMKNDEFIRTVTPAMSCNARQMISWDEGNRKFRCIFR